MKYGIVPLLLWTVPLIAQPHIAVRGEEFFRFGTLFQGSVLSHQVVLVNQGQDTLLIEYVNSPCNCTTTSLQSNRIAPNDSALLTITFHSGNFIDSVSKYVTIVSNDLRRRDLFIRFTANVVSLLRIVPHTLILGDIAVGKRVQGTVEVTNVSNDTLHLGRVICPGAGLQVDDRPVALAPGKKTSITLIFSPSVAKNYGARIEVELGRSDQPKAYFWVSGRGVLH